MRLSSSNHTSACIPMPTLRKDGFAHLVKMAEIVSFLRPRIATLTRRSPTPVVNTPQHVLDSNDFLPSLEEIGRTRILLSQQENTRGHIDTTLERLLTGISLLVEYPATLDANSAQARNRISRRWFKNISVAVSPMRTIGPYLTTSLFGSMIHYQLWYRQWTGRQCHAPHAKSQTKSINCVV